MNRGITGHTTVCGLIGDPVEHSMSPAMHNAAFAQLGLDYAYLPFRVRAADLTRAIDGIRGLNLRGMNVTIPHKVNVIPLLDRIDPLAERIGAVNTIVNDGGTLTGYNTDAAGFLRALREQGVEPGGKRVAVVGAGGAARAITFSLGEAGAEMVILNRLEELDWAEALAAKISQAFHRPVAAAELTPANLADALEKAELLVNATSLGMTPHTGASPVPPELLRPGLVVFDAVYNPIPTRLMREARAAGARTVSGLDMLVWQGALAFEMGTGQAAPAALTKKEALRLLQGQ
ncbi:MAG: shikimate dehydrogenase [Chloroflexota bacterium]